MVNFYRYHQVVSLQADQFIWDDTEEFFTQLLKELRSFEANAKEYLELMKAEKVSEALAYYNKCADFCHDYNISTELLGFWISNIDCANAN